MKRDFLDFFVFFVGNVEIHMKYRKFQTYYWLVVLRIRMNSPARKWTTLQDRFRNVVLEYDDYVIEHTEFDYLRNLAHTVQL